MASYAFGRRSVVVSISEFRRNDVSSHYHVRVLPIQHSCRSLIEKLLKDLG